MPPINATLGPPSDTENEMDSPVFCFTQVAPPSVVCSCSPPTAQPLFRSAKETSRRLFTCDALRCNTQLAPPSVDFNILPPSPMAHPVCVPGTKRTAPNQVPPGGCGTWFHVTPLSVLRKMRSLFPLTATSVCGSTMAMPVSGPVFPTCKDCHVLPPLVVCHTQLVLVYRPLITAHPSLLSRNAKSPVFEQVSH